MKRRQWDARTTAMIGIEGVKGKPVAARCHEQQISQSRSAQWRAQFLAQAAKACEAPQRTRKEARLQPENARLKPRVGELTVA
jgi:hypothetical protein